MDIFVLSKEKMDLKKVKSWLSFKLKKTKWTKKDYQDFLISLEKNRQQRLISLNKTLLTYRVKNFNWSQTLQIIKESLK